MGTDTDDSWDTDDAFQIGPLTPALPLTPAPPIAPAPPASDTRLHGWKLVLARGVAFPCLAATLVLYGSSLPGLIQQFTSPRCLPFPNHCLWTIDQAIVFPHLGLDPESSQVLLYGFFIVVALLAIGVAALLVWRRSDDWMALLVALMLALLPAAFLSNSPVLGSVLGYVILFTFYLLAATFPSGRFVPRWLWLPLLVLAILSWPDFLIRIAAPLVFDVALPLYFVCLVGAQIYRARRATHALQREPTKWAMFASALALPRTRLIPRWLWLPVLVLAIFSFPPLLHLAAPVVLPVVWIVVLPLNFVCLVGGQIYRYRRATHASQRQPIKWAVFGSAIVLLLLLLYYALLPAIFPALQQSDSLYTILSPVIDALAIAILTVSFAIAILRYRLYDIDILINRTPVYGSLTAILIVVYFSVVYAAQSLVRRIDPSAADSPVIVVGSTLLIAALCAPLLHRLQAVIDRRFYRRH